MKDNILLSFLLCTINNDDDFIRSINSLYAHKIDDVEFEVIVVDQGNSDRVSKLCQHYGAKYIPTNSIGLSVARNIGLKKCIGEYIALIDDDAFISKDYYEEFYSIIKNIDLEFVDSISGRIMTIENKSVPLSRYQGNVEKDININNIDTILSSALVVKRKIFNAIGNFDEAFGVGAKWGGSEETDLTARILNKNYTMKYIPSLIVYHPRTNFDLMSYSDTNKKAYNYGLGRGAFLKKHRYLPKYLILKNLFLPILAAFGSFLIFRPKEACRYFSSFLGRLIGYLGYSR